MFNLDMQIIDAFARGYKYINTPIGFIWFLLFGGFGALVLAEVISIILKKKLEKKQPKRSIK